jgi:hypothetical protein
MCNVFKLGLGLFLSLIYLNCQGQPVDPRLEVFENRDLLINYILPNLCSKDDEFLLSVSKLARLRLVSRSWSKFISEDQISLILKKLDICPESLPLLTLLESCDKDKALTDLEIIKQNRIENIQRQREDKRIRVLRYYLGGFFIVISFVLVNKIL